MHDPNAFCWANAQYSERNNAKSAKKVKRQDRLFIKRIISEEVGGVVFAFLNGVYFFVQKLG